MLHITMLDPFVGLVWSGLKSKKWVLNYKLLNAVNTNIPDRWIKQKIPFQSKNANCTYGENFVLCENQKLPLNQHNQKQTQSPG